MVSSENILSMIYILSSLYLYLYIYIQIKYLFFELLYKQTNVYAIYNKNKREHILEREGNTNMKVVG